MDESSKNLSEKIHSTAEKAVSSYVQGILTADALSQLMAQEWAKLYAEQHGDTQKEEKDNEEKEMQPSTNLLWRMAQRICSRTLHDAWCSQDQQLYELAYVNLERSFTRFLRHVRYNKVLQQYEQASEDAVYLTLVGLYPLRRGEKKLDDPAAFLGWAQVILHRKAIACLNKRKREETLSLDQDSEYAIGELVDLRNRDPVMYVIQDEFREELLAVLAAQRNKNHIQVLIFQFLEDLDDTEIAERMGVKVELVRVWRHRAFRLLREEHPTLAKLLRFLSN